MAAASYTRRSRQEYLDTFRRVEETKKLRAQCECAEALRRASDPIERAKTHLRRKGFVCFAAAVLPGGARGRTIVGRAVMSDEEVLAFARRKGFEG